LRRFALALIATFGLAASAFAATVTYNMAFAPEAMGATGSGSGSVVYDDAAHTLTINLTWGGTSGNSTVSHIHCCVDSPGVAGVAVNTPGLPLGVPQGTYSEVIDLTQTASYGASFLSANGGTPASAEAALKTQMDLGRAYFNIHTSTFGAGEIRAFLTVPEPALAGLLGAATLAVVSRRRRV
jgi:hypothetical protein